jgi:hypothetical protein
MEAEMADTYRDGNALAGPLAEVFAADVTAAVIVCAGCGRTDRVATLRVYGSERGIVARCSGCEAVVLRYARLPEDGWVDLRGAISLRFPMSADTAEGR